MAIVYIPSQMRKLTKGVNKVEVSGNNVLEILDELEACYPGLKSRLVLDDQLRPGMAISIGDQIAAEGVFTAVAQNAEIHFIPAIGGG